MDEGEPAAILRDARKSALLKDEVSLSDWLRELSQAVGTDQTHVPDYANPEKPRGFPTVSTAPHFDIDMAAFWNDPYPTLARLRKDAPIAFVPQLRGTVFASRDDIFVCEKNIDVFSSHQPDGLMNKLMGHNMMRKDGDAHMASARRSFQRFRRRP